MIVLRSTTNHLGIAMLALSACVACADGAPDVDAGEPTHVEEHARFFADEVISLTIGEGGGFRADEANTVVTGPPQGSGLASGSLDVVSLGWRGEIVLRLGVDVKDGAGPDLIVFENAFESGPRVFAEAGAVAVSDDGVTWSEFACDKELPAPNGCAGYAPVLSHPDNDVDPRDPDTAGGDLFDLANVGLTRARFVRIVDRGEEPGDLSLTTGGFDLDAIAVVHATVD